MNYKSEFGRTLDRPAACAYAHIDGARAGPPEGVDQAWRTKHFWERRSGVSPVGRMARSSSSVSAISKPGGRFPPLVSAAIAQAIALPGWPGSLVITNHISHVPPAWSCKACASARVRGGSAGKAGTGGWVGASTQAWVYPDNIAPCSARPCTGPIIRRWVHGVQHVPASCLDDGSSLSGRGVTHLAPNRRLRTVWAALDTEFSCGWRSHSLLTGWDARTIMRPPL